MGKDKGCTSGVVLVFLSLMAVLKVVFLMVVVVLKVIALVLLLEVFIVVITGSGKGGGDDSCGY